MTSQWERLLENVGIWVGSFTQFSPTGVCLHDTPTVVTLKPLDGGLAMGQEIHKAPPGESPTTRVLEYRSLNKGTLFFEGGAFSQGSIQWGPFSEFGAEMGFIADPHRLRVVSLFNKNQEFAAITLIREHRQGTSPSQRPELAIADLLGEWRGTAVTLYPDLRPPEELATHLTIRCQGQQVSQRLLFGPGAMSPNAQAPGGEVVSEGNLVADNRILFTTSSEPIQVLLLPDGASVTCPVKLHPRQSFFLETGWLVSPHQRQRMIRRYNPQGAWLSLTLVTEQRLPRADSSSDFPGGSGLSELD